MNSPYFKLYFFKQRKGYRAVTLEEMKLGQEQLFKFSLYQANQDITIQLIKTQNKDGTIWFITPAAALINMVSIYFMWFSFNKLVYYSSVFPFSLATC